MKRYVRASFDNPVPEWLKNDKSALAALSKAGADLKNMQISDTKVGKVADNFVVYHLQEGANNRDIVWIPGVYNDEYYTNYESGEWDYRIHRPKTSYGMLRNIPKKRLNIVDTIYVPKSGSNLKAPKERYEDPRYIYRKGEPHGQYGGQYFAEPSRWAGETEGKWTEQGRNEYVGRWSQRQRDKSGYVIPNPQARLNKFWDSPEGRTMYAKRASDKIESAYASLVDIKPKIMDIDLTTKGYEDALTNFGRAVRYYTDALEYLGNGKNERDRYYIRQAINSADTAQSDIDDVNKYLNKYGIA